MTNEKTYDDQIAPLMKQIITICENNNIPMVASFQLVNGGLECDRLFCRSYVPDKNQAGSPRRFVVARQILIYGAD